MTPLIEVRDLRFRYDGTQEFEGIDFTVRPYAARDRRKTSLVQNPLQPPMLFARSYYRAEGIHRAMMSRAFGGHFCLLSPLRFRATDAVFTAMVAAFLILVRVQ